MANLTKEELAKMVSDTVDAKTEKLDKKTDDILAKLGEIQAIGKADESAKDQTPPSMGIYNDFEDERRKGFEIPKFEESVDKYGHITVISKGYEKYSDEWFLNATPEQRFKALLIGIKEKQEHMIVKAHMLGNFEVTYDGKTKEWTSAKQWTKEQRISYGRFIAKDLSEGAPTAGGFLVPPDYRQILFDLVYQETVNLPSMWTRYYTTTGDHVYFPMLGTGCTVTWVGEGIVKPEGDPAFEQLDLHPKKQTIRVDVTEELYDDSNPAISGVLTTAFKNAMLTNSTYCFFYGDGATQPRGINLDIAGAETVFCGGTFDGDDLKNLECVLRQDYRVGAWWYMNDRYVCCIEKFKKSTTNDYMWGVDILDHMTTGRPSMLLGHPYYSGTDDTMPGGFAASGTGTGNYGHIFKGNPANYIAVIRTDLRVKFNDKWEWDKNIYSFICEARWDARMLPHTFAKLEGCVCVMPWDR